MNKKPTAIVFYTYLPPWRIDVFHAMADFYDVTIYFLLPNTVGFTYNRELLIKKLKVSHFFLENGFTIGSKPFRFGILKILKKHKPEVVFTHEYSPTSILLALIRMFNLISFKLVITTSDNLSMAKSVKGIKFFTRRFVLSQSTGIIVYSEPVRAWYSLNFPMIKTAICPNIQDEKMLLAHLPLFEPIIEQYKLSYNLSDKRVILFTGRLNYVKGLDLLINAYSKLNAEDTMLVIVGEGPQEKELRDLARSLNIEDKIVFPGFFSGVNLYAWYYLGDFFILPSRFEPFGAVVNEALVFGCPVMASCYIGALDFIRDRENGLIFDPLNANDFDTKLRTALSIFEVNKSNRRSLMIRDFNQYILSFRNIIQ